jgi:hypothetical protein
MLRKQNLGSVGVKKLENWNLRGVNGRTECSSVPHGHPTDDAVDQWTSNECAEKRGDE